MKMKRQAKHYGAPLTVKIERGALVIRIGAEVLAHAMKYAEWNVKYDEDKVDYVQQCKVIDPVILAEDTMWAMLQEREDGSTPLSDFIDKMTEAAVDDGSLGIAEESEDNPYSQEVTWPS